MRSIARALASHGRHFKGWRTKEKIIGFSVDDYGAIRLSSRHGRDYLQKVLDKPLTARMDLFDALETRVDLEALYEVLRSVQDSCGRHAVFTAYALSANPDIQAMRERGTYSVEDVRQSFQQAESDQPSAYEGAWKLWNEGIELRLVKPQFHGREHVNAALVQRLLDMQDPILQSNMEASCMAGLPSPAEMANVGFTHSFGLHDESQLQRHRLIISDGVRRFQDIYGYQSRTFTPPAGQLHPSLDGYAFSEGLEILDKSFFSRRPVGHGKTKWELNFMTPPTQDHQGVIVRTVSFEPTSEGYADPVGHAIKEIERAFLWNQPAIISSHRVNFAGHIDEKNRARGLHALSELLKRIIRRWPEVRFMAADEIFPVSHKAVA